MEDKKYYYIREDKTVAFVSNPEHPPIIEPGIENIKEVTNEVFVVGEDGYCYLREDLNSSEYLNKIEEIHKIDELFELHKFLDETDFIISKIAEAQIEGDNELVEQLKTKYASQVEQRKQARARINELEKCLNKN